MHKYDASAMLLKSSTDHGIRLSTLVAETGLWAHPDVHAKLITASGSGAFFPDRRRYRPGQGEKAGQHVGALTLDNNSYANHAIKRALGVSRGNLVGFETCHIWPLTCYDERYHTTIANLVLLPRAIAGLTDHHIEVQTALQYRAYRCTSGTRLMCRRPSGQLTTRRIGASRCHSQRWSNGR